MEDRVAQETLYRAVCWPLNTTYGHAYDGFKRALSDKEGVLGALDLPREYTDLLYTEIRSQMTAELLKNMEATHEGALELSQWGLATVPPAVLQLKRLTSLNLEANKIEVLAEGLGGLEALTELNLNGNPLRGLCYITIYGRITLDSTPYKVTLCGDSRRASMAWDRCRSFTCTALSRHPPPRRIRDYYHIWTYVL